MTVASSILTGALGLLRAALMRILPIAVIMAAAQMLQMLLELRQKTGSWAEVLKLLGDVAAGVWKGIVDSAGAIPPALASYWSSIVSSFYNMVSDMLNAWAGMLNSMGNAVEGVMPGLSNSLWSSATDAIASSTEWATAANEAAAESKKQWTAAGAAITNAWGPAAAAVQKIKDILGSDKPIDIRDWFGGDADKDGKGELEKIAEKLSDVKTLYGSVMSQFQALGPLGVVGLGQLNQMWAKFVEDMKTTHNPLVVIEQFKNALGEMGKQAGQIYDAVRGPMEQMFMDMVDGTKSVKDSFKSMAASVIKELYRIMVVQRLVNSILGFFGVSNPAMAAPIAAPSFAGGGSTGYGARSGGVDGKGGFPAILHPNETVVDHAAGQGTNGVVVNQTISFGSGVTRAEVQSMVPKIVEATKAAVLDARKRGGAYGSAFA